MMRQLKFYLKFSLLFLLIACGDKASENNASSFGSERFYRMSKLQTYSGDELLTETTFTYDSEGRLTDPQYTVELLSPTESLLEYKVGGIVRNTELDSRSYLVRETETFNGDHKHTSSFDPTYNSRGQLVEVVVETLYGIEKNNPNREIQKYEYNEVGDLEKMTVYDNSEGKKSSDDLGEADIVTIHTYSFDSNRKLLSSQIQYMRSSSGSIDTMYEYDSSKLTITSENTNRSAFHTVYHYEAGPCNPWAKSYYFDRGCVGDSQFK